MGAAALGLLDARRPRCGLTCGGLEIEILVFCSDTQSDDTCCREKQECVGEDSLK